MADSHNTSLSPSSVVPIDRRRKVALAEAGKTQSDLAREIGVTPQAISLEMRGRSSSRRVREKIAERLGKPVEYLFPEQVA